MGDLFGRKHFELSLEEKKLRLSLVLFEKIEFLYTDFPIFHTRFYSILHKCVCGGGMYSVYIFYIILFVYINVAVGY